MLVYSIFRLLIGTVVIAVLLGLLLRFLAYEPASHSESAFVGVVTWLSAAIIAGLDVVRWVRKNKQRT